MNKNKFFSLTVLVMIIASLFCVRSNALNLNGNQMTQSIVPLQVGHVDPTLSNPQPHKSPVQIPEVSLNNYSLTFDASCHGLTLQLVNADDEVEYTTVISSSTLVLPSTLAGEYEIRIICDDYYFYGAIEL